MINDHRCCRVRSLLRTLSIDYEECTRFVDAQLAGPHARWWREHRFFEVTGGTLMSDRAEYQLPFGMLGRLAAPLVRRSLREIL